jgi:hypothetical protein
MKINRGLRSNSLKPSSVTHGVRAVRSNSR